MAKNALKTADYKKLMNFLDHDQEITDKKRAKFKKIFTFLYYSGARINEVLKLKGKDIKDILTKKEARLITTKTAKYKDGGFRDVPFSNDAVQEIKEAFDDDLNHPDGYCLCPHNQRKRQLNLYTTVGEISKYLGKVFGEGKFTSHSFRAGIITEMIIDNDVNSKVVQTFIGHKSEATTMIYVKPTKNDVRANLVR